jgi:hypothetical protein
VIVVLDEQNVLFAFLEQHGRLARRRPTGQPGDAGADAFFAAYQQRVAGVAFQHLDEGAAAPGKFHIGEAPIRLREDRLDPRIV